jgi:hypothetical protein
MRIRTLLVPTLLGAVAAAPLAAQSPVPADTAPVRAVDWQSRFVAYGDNTEFFNPYTNGETLLGVQFWSQLSYRPDARFEVLAGLFGNHQLGSPDFFSQTRATLPHGEDTTTYSPIRPILSFRYHTAHSTGVMGTLITEDRHGLIEPLYEMRLDISRPVEYGVQWLERRTHFDGEVFLNWQHLNTPTSREIFDYGVVARGRLTPWLTLEGQMHAKHRGGQLFNAGETVANNHAGAIGLRLGDSLRVLGRSELAYFRVGSDGYLDTLEAQQYPDKGYGNYFRLKVAPGNWLDVVAIVWTGHGFHAEEGDGNYGSVSWEVPTTFKLDRFYAELGFIKRFRFRSGVTVDAEFRLHQIDNLKTDAISGLGPDYSYRIIGTVPLSVRLLGTD